MELEDGTRKQIRRKGLPTQRRSGQKTIKTLHGYEEIDETAFSLIRDLATMNIPVQRQA